MTPPISARTTTTSSTTTAAAPIERAREPALAPAPAATSTSTSTKTSAGAADRYDGAKKPERGLCGTEDESTCKVLRDGRLTLHKPTVPADQASPACKDGGRVFILDGLKKDPGDARTAEDFKAMGDARSSKRLQDSLRDARETARQAGCSVVTVRQAEGGELLGAYTDPKTVAIIHVGHGNEGTGHPVSADGQALGPDALDKDKVSKRLRSVDNIVCQGGKSKAEFQAALPEGVTFSGPDKIISTEKAEALAQEAAVRLRRTLAP